MRTHRTRVRSQLPLASQLQALILSGLVISDSGPSYSEGLPTLNSCGGGVFRNPLPVHINARHTLPNKLLDFVHARPTIGSSEEMVDFIQRHELGVVGAGFTAEVCADSLRSLMTQRVNEYNQNADRAAQELSLETESEVVRSILSDLLTR